VKVVVEVFSFQPGFHDIPKIVTDTVSTDCIAPKGLREPMSRRFPDKRGSRALWIALHEAPY